MSSLKSFLLLILSSFLILACTALQEKKMKPSLTKFQNLSTSMKNYTSRTNFARLKANFQKRDLALRIFGDSHMAADFFSRQLRRQLIEVNAVGFAYPLQPKYHQNLLLSYESKDYEIFSSQQDSTKDYPLGGVIARSLKEGASISLKTNLQRQNFKVGFVFKGEDKAFLVRDNKNKSLVLNGKKGNKWSYEEFKDLSFPLKIVSLKEGASLGGYFIYNQTNNKILDTLGINGARSDLWLRWNEDLILQELGIIKNDVVILAYGSNEVLSGAFNAKSFKENYKKLIRMFYKINPNTSIILISPPTVTKKVKDEYELASEFAEVRDAIYELAREERLLLFDMHDFMQKSGGKDLWIEQNLSLRDVHLKIEGYKLMADKFYSDLSELLNF